MDKPTGKPEVKTPIASAPGPVKPLRGSYAPLRPCGVTLPQRCGSEGGRSTGVRAES